MKDFKSIRTAPARFQFSEPDMKRILSGFAVREELLRLLSNSPRGDALGAALAFIVHAAQQDPGQLRSVLNSPINHNGQPARILDVITQLA